MVSKIFLVSAMIAYVQARFGQEQVPISAISSVQGGDPGAASTIAGAAISDLLGAANSCDKLATADKIVAQLGGGADAIAAAIGMVTAEKNTNPFANGNVQNVCGDATLPATAELRGITPLIDPAVDTDGGVAALSKQTAASPLDATGKSVFDLLSEAGFGDLVKAQNGGGAAAGGAAAGGNAGNAAGNAQNGQQNANGGQGQNDQNAGNAGNNADAGNAGNNADAGNAGNAQNDQNQNQDQNQGNQNANNGNAGNNTDAGNNADNAQNGQNAQNDQNANQGNNQQGNNNNGNANAGNGNAAAGGAADFGQCTPTIFRQGGLNGRPATEFTFQITDPLARGGQQEALNPNIITNALCNQLTNVCGANAAAVTQCESAKAAVQAAGTRDDSTVTLFNDAIQGGGAAKKARSVGVSFRA